MTQGVGLKTMATAKALGVKVQELTSEQAKLL